MNYCFSFFPFSHSFFLNVCFVAENNGNNMKLWEFRSSLIVINERIFVYNFLHMSNEMNVVNMRTMNDLEYKPIRTMREFNSLNAGDAKCKLLLTCLNIEFNLKSCICCSVLCTFERYKQSIVISDWRKRNSIFGKTERNETCFSNILNDSLPFFAFKFKIKIKIIKIFCRHCIQFDWQLRENDLIILALPKPWTTGCADLIEAHCILNDENFICPAKQKTKIQQFVWRTMKQMITLVK